MIHTTKAAAFLAIALAAWPVAAQQQPYSLDECRRLALKNSVAVHNAANSVEAARQAEREAFTRYFPSVSATAMGFAADKGLMQMKTCEGMKLSLLKSGIAAGVTLTQPVFAGGQIVNANRLAKAGTATGRLQQEASQDEVLLTVDRYFWQVVTLQEKLHTVAQVEKQLERIGRDVEAAVGAGITTRNDLLQVQLRQGDMESRRISLQNSLSVCRMMLAQYAGLPSAGFMLQATVSTDTVPPLPRHLPVDHRSALTSTASCRLLSQNVGASRLQRKLASGRNLPTVAVGAGYM